MTLSGPRMGGSLLAKYEAYMLKMKRPRKRKEIMYVAELCSWVYLLSSLNSVLPPILSSFFGSIERSLQSLICPSCSIPTLNSIHNKELININNIMEQWIHLDKILWGIISPLSFSLNLLSAQSWGSL